MQNKYKENIHANRLFLPMWAAIGMDGSIIYVVGNLKPADVIRISGKSRYIVMGPAPIIGSPKKDMFKIINEYTYEKNDQKFLGEVLISKSCDISRNKILHVKNFEPAVLRFRIIDKLWNSSHSALYIATGGPKENPWTIYVATRKNEKYLLEKIREGNEYVGYGWFKWFSNNILHFRLVLALSVKKISPFKLLSEIPNESLYTMSALGEVI